MSRKTPNPLLFKFFPPYISELRGFLARVHFHGILTGTVGSRDEYAISVRILRTMADLDYMISRSLRTRGDRLEGATKSLTEPHRRRLTTCCLTQRARRTINRYTALGYSSPIFTPFGQSMLDPRGGFRWRDIEPTAG